MSPKRRKWMMIVVLVAAMFVFCTFVFYRSGSYIIENGKVYRVAPILGWKTHVDTLYDPGFYGKHYQEDKGTVYRIDTDAGKRYPVRMTFEGDFENIQHIKELVGPVAGWTHFTLQSPQAMTVPDYNRLRNRILKEGGNFLDNRIEPSLEQFRKGTQALRFYVAAPTPEMICAKSSLSTSLLHFRKGDHVWFSAWFFLDGPRDAFFTFMDLESSFIKQHAGMRIRLSNGKLDMELAKWLPNPVYRQPEGKAIDFPASRWVNVAIHLRLSAKADGIVQVWQDGTLIIDQTGQNLPFAGALYDILEIGLSAYSLGKDPATLYVDDVYIGHDPKEGSN